MRWRCRPFDHLDLLPRLVRSCSTIAATSALALLRFRWLRAIVVDPDRARALAQGILQADRPPVLLQQVGERFVGEFLKRTHAVAGVEVERREGRGIEGHTLADLPFGALRHR